MFKCTAHYNKQCQAFPAPLKVFLSSLFDSETIHDLIADKLKLFLKNINLNKYLSLAMQN